MRSLFIYIEYSIRVYLLNIFQVVPNVQYLQLSAIVYSKHCYGKFIKFPFCQFI